jgi:hypothetical protein
MSPSRALPLLALVIGACGPDLGPPLPDPGPSSGLDASKMLIDLTREEAAAFCDWTAGRFGGYGRGITCADGSTLSARQSQAQCVEDWTTANPNCPLSVGDFEECVNGGVVEPRCASVPPVCLGVVFCQ